jgi:hypothetical protein
VLVLDMGCGEGGVVVASIVYRSIVVSQMTCVTHRLCRVGRFLEIGDWDHLNNMITMLQQKARRIVLVFRNQTQRKYTGTHVLPGTRVLYTRVVFIYRNQKI